MEKEIKIKTKDNHIIYGTLNTSAKKKTKKLIIFVPGLGGSQHSHMFYNAARFFTQKGIATYRMDLYSGGEKARILHKTTLKMHAQDISRAVQYFKKKYKYVYLVGHSLGGLAILQADISGISGIVLWDPSHKSVVAPYWKKQKYNRSLKACLATWGMTFLLGKRMRNEVIEKMDSNDRIADVHVPLKIISAGKGVLKNSNKEYFKYANEPKKLVTLVQADHNFTAWGVLDDLFKETLVWIQKY